MPSCPHCSGFLCSAEIHPRYSTAALQMSYLHKHATARPTVFRCQILHNGFRPLPSSLFYVAKAYLPSVWFERSKILPGPKIMFIAASWYWNIWRVALNALHWTSLGFHDVFFFSRKYVPIFQNILFMDNVRNIQGNVQSYGDIWTWSLLFSLNFMGDHHSYWRPLTLQIACRRHYLSNNVRLLLIDA